MKAPYTFTELIGGLDWAHGVSTSDKSIHRTRLLTVTKIICYMAIL